MSPDEDKPHHETFAVFDANDSGTVDLDKFQIGLSKRRGANYAESATAARALARLFDRFDTNHDGVLQRDELGALLASVELEKFFAQSERRPSVVLQSVYGQAPTPPETEESVKAGLAQLQAEIDAMGDEPKRGLSQALEKCPHLVDDAFRLMFLRTEVFDSRRAAQRLTTYWNKRIEVFGEVKAFLPLTQEEALVDDATTLSLGFLRPTGQSDPAGRAVLLMDFSREGKADYALPSLVRAVWYVIHAALGDDGAQKRGVVILVKPSESLGQADIKAQKELASHMQGALPFRLGCFHICHPPTFVNIALKIARVFLPKKLRSRIRKHKGTQKEILESLAFYSIPVAAVPNVWGGKLDYEDRLTWLETQRSIEGRTALGDVH